MNGNKKQVSFEELLLYVNFTQNALIILLWKKGIVTWANIKGLNEKLKKLKSN